MKQQDHLGIGAISIEDKEVVVRAVKSIMAHTGRPDRKHIVTLFRMYHKYVYRSPADTACPSCVQFIYKFWKQQFTEWQNDTEENG